MFIDVKWLAELINSAVVVEITIRNWLAVFEDKIFYRLLIAVPLKMYRKFEKPNEFCLAKYGNWSKMANEGLLFPALDGMHHMSKIFSYVSGSKMPLVIF